MGYDWPKVLELESTNLVCQVDEILVNKMA